MSEIPDYSSHGYQIIREIGRNQEAGRITYLATSTPPNQGEYKKQVRVVIKEFRLCFAGADWSGFKAYQREIEVLLQLSHSRIPRYLNSFETPHGFCLVQEYKDAPFLAEKHSFKPEEIKKIARSVLEILAELQQRTPPVIHRDIKPENILVDEQLNAYLVDFGFARIRGGELALSSVAAGTPGFMPPEEQFGRTLTEASDLYSLGATLICLLTGTRSADVGKLIDDDYRFSFRHLVPKLNVRFAEWLEKMVASSVKERFPNAGVALAALKPVDVAGGVTLALAERKVRSVKWIKKLVFLSVFAGYVTFFLILSLYIPVARLLLFKECRDCNFWDANLGDANLEGAMLKDAGLSGANLKGANLENGSLVGANLEGANLVGANLVAANLRGAKLRGANLKGANLVAANLEDANLEDANLEGAKLRGANLMSAELNDGKLEGANLEDTNLLYATLMHANLKGANLKGASFLSTYLWDANLEGANLEGANLEGAKLKGVKLKGANLKGAKIDKDAELDDKWRLVWQIVNEGAKGADLKAADLEGANLESGNLEGANLEGANLKGANLKGANLKGAKLEGAKLEGAIMPDNTKHE